MLILLFLLLPLPFLLINEQSTGRSFHPLARYLEEGREDENGERPGPAERVAFRRAHNLFAEPGDWRSVALEMRDTSKMSSRIERPVHHNILSWPEGERPGPERAIEAGRRHLEEMGYNLDETQVYFVAHRGQDDLHMLANRVQLNGEVWQTSWNYAAGEAAADIVSMDMGFPLIDRHWRNHMAAMLAERKGEDLGVPDRTGPTSGEVRLWKQAGQEPLSERVRESLKDDFETAGGWAELLWRLREKECKIMRKRGGGVVAPLSTTDVENTPSVKLSAIGRPFSLGRLEKRFGKTLREHQKQQEQARNLSHHTPSVSNGHRQEKKHELGR